MENHLGKEYGCEDECHDGDAAFAHTRGDVGEMAQGMDTEESHGYHEESDDGIDECLNAASAVVRPKPCYDGAQGVFCFVKFH